MSARTNILHLDHLQLAIPAGSEARLQDYYYGVLGFAPLAKPAELQGRGGFWAQAGSAEIHFGVDPSFIPATKAHPAFVVADLDLLAQTLTDAGYQIAWDTKLPQVRRFFTNDPVGNRIEFISA